MRLGLCDQIWGYRCKESWRISSLETPLFRGHEEVHHDYGLKLQTNRPHLTLSAAGVSLDAIIIYD